MEKRDLELQQKSVKIQEINYFGEIKKGKRKVILNLAFNYYNSSIYSSNPSVATILAYYPCVGVCSW